MTPTEYWRSGEGLSNITPRNEPWPEGLDFIDFLPGLIGGSTILEIGCGPGRLAALFPSEQYRGLDICEEALRRARQALPLHRFDLVEDDDVLQAAEVTLLYTILLHIPDDAIGRFVARITSPRVLVGEILGRSWRRSGLPPVFNREAGEYEAIFAPRFRLANHHRRPYARYPNAELAILEFVQ